jgi:hypothetical protein
MPLNIAELAQSLSEWLNVRSIGTSVHEEAYPRNFSRLVRLEESRTE